MLSYLLSFLHLGTLSSKSIASGVGLGRRVESCLKGHAFICMFNFKPRFRAWIPRPPSNVNLGGFGLGVFTCPSMTRDSLKWSNASDPDLI